MFYDALQKEFLYQNITTRPCAALNGSECPVGYSLCNSRRLQIIGNQADATVRPPTIGGLRIEIKKTGNLRNYHSVARRLLRQDKRRSLPDQLSASMSSVLTDFKKPFWNVWAVERCNHND